MSGHKCVWAQTCVGTIVFGHKRVWAQSCLGTIVSGHNRVWAQSCLGTIVWAQVCMGTIVWSPVQRIFYEKKFQAGSKFRVKTEECSKHFEGRSLGAFELLQVLVLVQYGCIHAEKKVEKLKFITFVVQAMSMTT